MTVKEAIELRDKTHAAQRKKMKIWRSGLYAGIALGAITILILLSVLKAYKISF
jgi:formate/nitrite transporter FocA (FNT family)